MRYEKALLEEIEGLITEALYSENVCSNNSKIRKLLYRLRMTDDSYLYSRTEDITFYINTTERDVFDPYKVTEPSLSSKVRSLNYARDMVKDGLVRIEDMDRTENKYANECGLLFLMFVITCGCSHETR